MASCRRYSDRNFLILTKEHVDVILHRTGSASGKPRWLRRSLPTGPEYEKIRQLLKGHGLTTVCQEAQCPNQFECYGQGTATFMILGERCTRNCRFCAVGHRPETPPDPEEPERVAEAVALLDLRYAVVTSVTRDDLPDGGAALFAETITAIRRARPGTLIEVLIPDLQGDRRALTTILDAGPDVLNHNIETVARLYPEVRPQAELPSLSEPAAPGQGQSIRICRPNRGSCSALAKSRPRSKRPGVIFGTPVRYPDHGPVSSAKRRPSAGAALSAAGGIRRRWRRGLWLIGFAGVAAGPFVRSSYQAESLYRQALKRIKGIGS